MKRKNGIKNLYWLIYLFYAISFIFSLKNDKYIFDHSISIDLLYRVVGSRLMEDGQSPYYQKWEPGKQATYRYYHPIPRFSQKINGVTVTPAILWLNKPLANEDFCDASKQWFNIEVFVLFLTGLILLVVIQSFWRKLITAIVLVAFFLFSRNFYLHLHSAQLYVVYGLLFSVFYLLLKSNFRSKYILLGSLIIIAAWLKPFFLVVLLPFIFRKNRDVFKGAAIAGFILLFQVLFTGQFKYWKEYSSAMAEYATDIPIASKQQGFLQIYPPEFPVSSCIYPMRYPDQLPLTASGLRSVQYYLTRINISIANATIFGVAALMIVLLICRRSKRNNSPEHLVGLMFLLYIIMELFTPSLRFGYYVVEWSTVAVILVCNFRSNKISAVLMLIGLIINNGYAPFPKVYSGATGEALMLLGLIYYVLSAKKLSDNSSAAVCDATKVQ